MVFAAYILSSAAIALAAFTILAYVVFRHLQNVAKVSDTVPGTSLFAHLHTCR